MDRKVFMMNDAVTMTMMDDDRDQDCLKDHYQLAYHLMMKDGDAVGAERATRAYCRLVLGTEEQQRVGASLPQEEQQVHASENTARRYCIEGVAPIKKQKEFLQAMMMCELTNNSMMGNAAKLGFYQSLGLISSASASTDSSASSSGQVGTDDNSNAESQVLPQLVPDRQASSSSSSSMSPIPSKTTSTIGRDDDAQHIQVPPRIHHQPYQHEHHQHEHKELLPPQSTAAMLGNERTGPEVATRFWACNETIQRDRQELVVSSDEVFEHPYLSRQEEEFIPLVTSSSASNMDSHVAAAATSSKNPTATNIPGKLHPNHPSNDQSNGCDKDDPSFPEVDRLNVASVVKSKMNLRDSTVPIRDFGLDKDPSKCIIFSGENHPSYNDLQKLCANTLYKSIIDECVMANQYFGLPIHRRRNQISSRVFEQIKARELCFRRWNYQKMEWVTPTHQSVFKNLSNAIMLRLRNECQNRSNAMFGLRIHPSKCIIVDGSKHPNDDELRKVCANNQYERIVDKCASRHQNGENQKKGAKTLDGQCHQILYRVLDQIKAQKLFFHRWDGKYKIWVEPKPRKVRLKIMKSIMLRLSKIALPLQQESAQKQEPKQKLTKTHPPNQKAEQKDDFFHHDSLDDDSDPSSDDSDSDYVE